jgi:hypothetical protein
MAQRSSFRDTPAALQRLFERRTTFAGPFVETSTEIPRAGIVDALTAFAD